MEKFSSVFVFQYLFKNAYRDSHYINLMYQWLILNLRHLGLKELYQSTASRFEVKHAQCDSDIRISQKSVKKRI